jgi:hypothetical protein
MLLENASPSVPSDGMLSQRLDSKRKAVMEVSRRADVSGFGRVGRFGKIDRGVIYAFQSYGDTFRQRMMTIVVLLMCDSRWNVARWSLTVRLRFDVKLDASPRSQLTIHVT